MTYDEVLAEARKHIGTTCRACPVCNGLACGNTLPGPGSKAPGNGANDNYQAWQKIRLNMDTIAENIPADPACTLFGRAFSLPLLTGPIGSVARQFNPDTNVMDYNDAVFAASARCGVLPSYGDGLVPEVLERGLTGAARFGGNAIPILNPNADEDLMKKLDRIRADMPIAAGIVVDSAGLPHLKAMNAKAGTKTVAQLRALKEYAGLPLLIKGVMTARGAEKAAEAGADAIIVSNHGGRALAQTPATAEVLPEIARTVGKDLTVIVDGGIRTGLDIFKALALGADAAMICRPVVVSWYGAGEEGVATCFEKFRAELVDAMYMCGARSLADITPDMVRCPW